MAVRGQDGTEYARRHGFVSPGGDLESAKLETVDQAEAQCAFNEECIGFTFRSTCSSALHCQTAVTLKREFNFQQSHQNADVVYIKKMRPANDLVVHTGDGKEFVVVQGQGARREPGAELWWAWLLLAAAIVVVGLMIMGFFVRKMRRKRLERAFEEKQEEERSCAGGMCAGSRSAEDKPLMPKDEPWWDQIRQELEGRYEAETIEEFKKQFFGGIDHWMGREILKDVDTALLVRVNHTTWCGCLVLSLLTLGLYACFRPRQDLAILVVTKSGRVILLKRLPHSMLGFEPGHSISVIILYIVLLIIVTLAPVATGYFLTEYLDMDYKGLIDLLHPSIAASLRASLGHQWKVYYAIVFLFWAAFLVWVWTHRQRGYGRRFLREFKASSVAAAQYLLEDEGCLANCCVARGRYGHLRLYFGKYPAQEELDEGLPWGAPRAHAVVPLDSLSAHEDGSGSALSGSSPPSAGGGGGADRGGLERKVSSYFPILSFVLLASTAIAEGLKFYGYYEQYHKMDEANVFCKQASVSGSCDEEHCRQWAAAEEIDNVAFCGHVKWIKTSSTISRDVLTSVGLNADALAEHASSPKAACSILRVGMEECCSGCIHGHLFEWLGGDDIEKWWDNLSTALSYVLLFLALFMSKMAMAYKFSQKKETNCLDIEFVQNFNQPEDDYFNVKDELALRVLQRVFDEAGIHKDTTKSAKRVGRSSQGTDVEIHEDLTDIYTWHDFFRHHRLVKYDDSAFGQQEPTDYYVPRRCLGMSTKEKVIEVWTEQPFLSYTERIYILIGSFVLVVLLAFWPAEYGGPTIFGRCNGDGRSVLACKVVRWAKVITSSILLGVVLGTLRYIISYRRQQSIVVVTNERIYAIYHRPHWLALLCPAGCGLPFVLRVETFRHGDTTFYGRMSSRTPPWHVRLCGTTRWNAGEVVFKCKFGVLELSRHWGEVTSLYQLVSTILVKQVENYDFKGLRMQVPVWYGIKEPDDEATTVEPSYFSSFFSRRKRPFSFENIEGDPYGRKKVTWTAELDGREAEEVSQRHFEMAPGKEEQLVYIWSFQEAGLLADPYNRYNDVVVTTDRIRFHSKSEFKTFDCRTCLCWGFCWCACLKRWCGTEFKPEVRAFLNFSHLEAFSTETSMMPAVCLCRCPCYDALCGMLTGLICCDFVGCKASAGQCFELPGTTEPKAQLWLRWLQRYARSSQPDMVLSQRPCRLERPGQEEMEGQVAEDPEQGGCHCCWPLPVLSKDVPEVRDLRELMRFVLEKEERRLSRQESRW